MDGSTKCASVKSSVLIKDLGIGQKNCQIGVRMRHKLFFVSGCLCNGISKLERIRKGKMKFLVR